MKAITVNFVGEASIKENKVVVDYTELKELVNNHEKLIDILRELTGAASHVAAESLFDPVDRAIEILKQAEKE